ncbi:MAG: acyl-phosphate glycerol 3-phosphate acyltransferase [Candidatus Melainabacteria bacterium GWA2_34_9]|nr:MAG: acyl-phosphate glycerol 3-phosphate acyltransferase [Candidatus Melainabacteria bacterium GWA2_34_9]
MIVLYITTIILAYLIGSFPTGYILVKALKGIDIREVGSGSTGATNVKRVLGIKAYIFVMFVDALKGLLPVLAAKYIDSKMGIILSDFHILPVLVAVAVIMGHSKSIFLKFTGGKSVASGVGTILGLNPVVGLITIISWVFLTYFTKIVSISSIAVILLTPVWMFVFKQPLSYILYCLLGALYIVYLHRENIKRLISGSENKIRN